MVKSSFSTLIVSEYESVKQNACGRQACSVMIIVADEVNSSINPYYDVLITNSYVADRRYVDSSNVDPIFERG